MENPDKIVVGLGNQDSIQPGLNKKSNEKISEWLENNSGPVVKDSEIITEKKIGEVKGELNEKYEKPKSLNILKKPELGNTFKMPEKKKSESFSSKAKKLGRKILLTLGLSAISMSAKGEGTSAEKAFTDSAQNKTEKVTGGIRKVKIGEVPKDYKLIREEGEKKIYERNLRGDKLEMAQSSTSKGGPEYEKKLISLLKSGISPQELADKKYISPEKIPDYQKYYVEYKDYVYTEPEKTTPKKEADPFAKYAVKGEGVYMPGVSGHNAGQIYYLSMQSKNIQEAGMANTGDEDFVIQLEDANGKRLNLAVKIPAKEKNKYFGTTNHLLPGAFEALKKLAEEQGNKEIKDLGPDFTAKNNTVGLPGSIIDRNK